ncbi:MAG TPA: TcmI family type II polyketide cyclase [Streptosporangiaceae bacterium]|jgi:predicted ester cyclase
MQTQAPAEAQRNKDVVRLVTEKGFNEGDLAGITQYFTPDYEVHAPGVPPLPPGAGAFHAAVTLWREAFPDIHVTVEDMVCEGAKVYCRFTTRGTHTGPLMGIPATGKQVTVYEMSCHRLSAGKVAESWIGDNVPSILHQVGALTPPQPGPPGAAPHRSIIVARMTPGSEAEIARIWARSDETELPKLAGVWRRELYRLGDLYLHVIETEQPGTQAVGVAREQEEFKRISDELAAFISPYLPTWRSPQDALAARFYTWESPRRPGETGATR